MSTRFALKQLLEYLNGSDVLVEVYDEDMSQQERYFIGIASLESAAAEHLSFLANAKYAAKLDSSNAGAVFMTAKTLTNFAGIKLITCDPYLAYAKASQFLQERVGDILDVSSQIHPSAVVHASAKVHPSAALGPNVVVGAHSVIDEGVHIGAGSVIGRHVHVGANTRLAALVSVYDGVKFGQRCRVQSQASIGSDGFGFAPSPKGWVPIAQLGAVSIGDDVHIGANTSIDRGALEDTIIENQVIIDNQVQIAHNVKVGHRSAIAGCVGIAGSTRVGQNCTIAGAAGLAGHLDIADNVHIGMQAQVTKSISEAGAYASGTGLYPLKNWRRLVGRLRRLIR